MPEHFVSASCGGEHCGMCQREGVTTDAAHKVGEEIPHDDPMRFGHNLTQYVCCRHFAMIVGPTNHEAAEFLKRTWRISVSQPNK